MGVEENDMIPKWLLDFFLKKNVDLCIVSIMTRLWRTKAVICPINALGPSLPLFGPIKTFGLSKGDILRSWATADLCLWGRKLWATLVLISKQIDHF